MTPYKFPCAVYSGEWPSGHCQGIAVDEARGYIYFSFTTELVKADLNGNIIGSARGLAGHLGCIAFCREDGCIYGSLEYKHDEIGRDIIQRAGMEAAKEDAFYIARFDTDSINRVGMDAFSEGIMSACFLKEVADDYAAVLPDGQKHRYGCSGIDGLTFAPLFGAPRDSKRYLMVAYGIYGDNGRSDNDHQVILVYDASAVCRAMKPLDRLKPHHSSADGNVQKLFVYTGNTCYGVQNMEYDPFTGDVFMAVYTGSKPEFPNKPMYVVNGSRAPEVRPLAGIGCDALQLELKGGAEQASGVRGLDFEYGSTGMCALGGGLFYFSHDEKREGGWCSTARLYRWNGRDGFDAAD